MLGHFGRGRRRRQPVTPPGCPAVMFPSTCASWTGPIGHRRRAHIYLKCNLDARVAPTWVAVDAALRMGLMIQPAAPYDWLPATANGSRALISVEEYTRPLKLWSTPLPPPTTTTTAAMRDDERRNSTPRDAPVGRCSAKRNSTTVWTQSCRTEQRRPTHSWPY